MAWQSVSPEVTVKGFKKCCIFSTVECGMTVKRMGVLGVCVRMMNALSVKMETVTLMDKGR
jgi:hypothetical protein